MTWRRTASAALVSGIAGCAAAALLAPTAWAHDTSATLNAGPGYDYGYGGVTNGHTRIYSCDTYRNGIGFRSEYKLRSGARGYVDDANGSSSGCSGIYPGTSSNPITMFRVISKGNAAGKSCCWVYSGWYYA